MPRNDRKRRVPGNSACLPTKLKSRSVVDLITSGVDVSGADEYCRPKPSTKTATITGSSATSPDFLGNLIAPPILVLTNDQEKLVSSVFTCWLVCNTFTRGYPAFYSVLEFYPSGSFWIGCCLIWRIERIFVMISIILFIHLSICYGSGLYFDV